MSNPIRLGLVGAGRAGWGMHTKELEGREDKFSYAAVCDLIEERRTKMVQKYGCKAYEHMNKPKFSRSFLQKKTAPVFMYVTTGVLNTILSSCVKLSLQGSWVMFTKFTSPATATAAGTIGRP